MLELYQKEGCPYCQKVRAKMTELDLDYICRNVRDGGSKKAQLLEKLGGMVQVPFLIDTDRNVAMYESEDIIKYLVEHYS
ncbi:MAG: glutaredoxin [Candidatus Abyssobacteria bacterium SURF_5]|uniref:Glutaredoxin n=1 Tax=Abyssobacteria bacterium (strain SURF_5) TaxID=2093360 RepID=A0A3A4P1K2_ABYX5|nr:MAG: glutaredoxin [Candidatus Abyssubacteria bacterium SURF_5]